VGCTKRKQSQKSTCTSIVLDTDEIGGVRNRVLFWWPLGCRVCLFQEYSSMVALHVYEVLFVMLARENDDMHCLGPVGRAEAWTEAWTCGRTASP
jgi:hypothetical protein